MPRHATLRKYGNVLLKRDCWEPFTSHTNSNAIPNQFWHQDLDWLFDERRASIWRHALVSVVVERNKNDDIKIEAFVLSSYVWYNVASQNGLANEASIPS